MNIVQGNMFDEYRRQNTLWCFTANSYIKRNGRLTMGAGIAKAVATTWPETPAMFGEMASKNGGHLGKFGLLVIETKALAAFQTKKSWQDNSTLELIEFSAYCLMDYLDSEDAKFTKACLNMPGVGYGNLQRDDVISTLEPILDDRVQLWEYKKTPKNYNSFRQPRTVDYIEI